MNQLADVITQDSPMSKEAKADMLVIKAQLVIAQACNNTIGKVRAMGGSTGIIDKKFDESILKMHCALNGVKYDKEL
jgi:hypothetical protein